MIILDEVSQIAATTACQYFRLSPNARGLGPTVIKITTY